MSKLFILGNGFDIASGLNTRYSDFRKWFISNYDLDYERLDRIVDEEAFSELEVPSSSIGRHGEVVYDESLTDFFYVIISYANDKDVLWSGFETNLSKLPFYDFEDCYYYDGEDEFEEANIVEQVGNNLAHVFVDAVNEYFMNWIRHIYMTEQPINKKKLVCENKDSTFLTFNYTNVLEDFYDIRDDSICHIHGCIKGGEQIIVGHGEDDFYRRDFDPLDINSYVDDAKQTLRKPIKEIILKNKDFFDGLGVLEEIYIIGLGLDNPDFVDAPYLQEVFKHTFEGTILYFDCFDKGKRTIYKETCKRNGFVGQYGISDSTTGEKYLF